MVVSKTEFTWEDYLQFPEDGRRHEIIAGEHYVGRPLRSFGGGGERQRSQRCSRYHCAVRRMPSRVVTRGR